MLPSASVTVHSWRTRKKPVRQTEEIWGDTGLVSWLSKITPRLEAVETTSTTEDEAAVTRWSWEMVRLVNCRQVPDQSSWVFSAFSFNICSPHPLVETLNTFHHCNFRDNYDDKALSPIQIWGPLGLLYCYTLYAQSDRPVERYRRVLDGARSVLKKETGNRCWTKFNPRLF